MARPLKAAIVSSTKPDSLSVSVWIATWTSCRSATVQAVVDRRRRRAPVLVQLQAAGAGLDLLLERAPAGWRCPCPGSRGSSGRRRPPAASRGCATGPGVQVVAKVPVAGPVPPPSIVVTPLASASSICCGQMKWMCESMPPAVTIIPSPAMISVPGPMTMSTPGCTSGLPALPMRGDAAVLDADVGLDDAPVVDDQRVGDDGVGHLRRRGAGSGPCRRGWSCRRRTSPPRRSRRRAGCSRPRPR